MEWISVKDKLPEKDGTYLTINSYGRGGEIFGVGDYYTVTMFYGYMIRKYHSNKKIFSNKCGNDYVTHWMPLPKPPECGC